MPSSNLCNAYAQLGARGVSILYASGDGGVSGSQANNACNGQAFVPTFPSGCPLYVRHVILYLYNATNDRAP